MTLILRLLLAIVVVFVLPAAATIGWWLLQERPPNWSSADWSSSRLLPRADADAEPAVYVLAARTGGLKGALSVHSWLVIKHAGATAYDRYDKVGWGSPVRRNSRPADGFWYSNPPVVVHSIHGDAAQRLIPSLEQAIETYPWSRNGDYRVWPGPNSNSFVAHVLREVPGLGAVLPPNATGRDFRTGFVDVGWSENLGDAHLSLHGLAGITIGRSSGFEIHFMGLVAGIDVLRPAIKVPALGRVPIPGLS